MPTINDALQNLDAALPRFNGANITTAEVTNTNASSDASAVTIPEGTKHLWISARDAELYKVWILALGASAPVKATPTPGGMTVATAVAGRIVDFEIDPVSPPSVWVAETAGTDRTFDIITLK